MSPDITSRPIALVGLMGVGKTTVGRRLAKKLDRAFFDSDDEIEHASGRTVAGYFLIMVKRHFAKASAELSNDF